MISLKKEKKKWNDEIGFIHLKFNQYNNVSNNGIGFLLPFSKLFNLLQRIA